MAIKRKRKTKPASRIPGVQVGDEVETTVGKKKKVCFNVGGKWFFRTVDTDWRAPGRPIKRRRAHGTGLKEGKNVTGTLCNNLIEKSY